MPRRSSKNPRTTGSRYNARINRTPRTNPSQTRTAEFDAIKVPVKQLLAAIDWVTQQTEHKAVLKLEVVLFNGAYLHQLVDTDTGSEHQVSPTFARKLSYIGAFKGGNEIYATSALALLNELYENREQ